MYIYYYLPPEAEGYCVGAVRPSGCPSVTFVSGAISWKCFGVFHWNLVWVYICIRGWCMPNGIVYHLLITELWPFVSWKNAFYYRHFCVRSHILEVLWRISYKLGMSKYSPARGGGILFWRCPAVRPSLLCPEPYLGSALVYFIETLYHAKWHCTQSVKTRVMALCILKKFVSLFIRPICTHPQTKHMLRGISILRICLFLIWLGYVPNI